MTTGGWNFETDPAWQEQLDWARDFVQREVLPLEALELDHSSTFEAIRPLQREVKERGMWALNLGPELGGQGVSQVKLALLLEVLGGSELAGLAFWNHPPDSGNVELLALAGSDDQKERWLRPLLAGEVLSSFAMTEQGTGSDPRQFRTRAVRDGDEWVVDGTKWFVANAARSAFHIVMCLTGPEADSHHGHSMIVVPADAPGISMRPIGNLDDPEHKGALLQYCEIEYRGVRVPVDHLLGPEGEAFILAQQRAGPNRVHHFMRWMGIAQRAFDDMCERSVSISVHGGRLADKQFVQEFIALSASEIAAARLLGLHTAWRLDRDGPLAARAEISMLKYHGTKVMNDVLDRAIQVYGSLGVSTDMPLGQLYAYARTARIYDGPDEVHKALVAKLLTRDIEPVDVPTDHVPTRRAAALRRRQEEAT
ncbi:MAG: acyl-CoA dehydrogenase domain protein [Solirubrobacterales bacterium]|nr:acyl-CoA dehydrogenase domain protein [Solirubrobacterales bacterium]